MPETAHPLFLRRTTSTLGSMYEPAFVSVFCEFRSQKFFRFDTSPNHSDPLAPKT